MIGLDLVQDDALGDADLEVDADPGPARELRPDGLDRDAAGDLLDPDLDLVQLLLAPAAGLDGLDLDLGLPPASSRRHRHVDVLEETRSPALRGRVFGEVLPVLRHGERCRETARRRMAMAQGDESLTFDHGNLTGDRRSWG
ncbi:MAG: hypothetical protein MZV64_18420 [Ignavibacteriales bacterium]|nr:hypothetical protein [Ignavibacteriales bacterium]